MSWRTLTAPTNAAQVSALSQSDRDGRRRTIPSREE
jgi:hypothetical protein